LDVTYASVLCAVDCESGTDNVGAASL
jgi:hypothetical protein